MLKHNEIDYFYQEVTLTEGVQHTNINELKIKIPNEQKHKVYCMHLNDKTAEEVEKLGFNLVDIAF